MAAPIEAPIDFRACVGFDDDEVSEEGVVRKIETGHVLATPILVGMPSVHIGRTSVLLKLAVARAWLAPDPARNCVLHIDKDKTTVAPRTCGGRRRRSVTRTVAPAGRR